MSLPKVRVKNLGLIDYQEAWDLQESLLKAAVDCKKLSKLEVVVK